MIKIQNLSLNAGNYSIFENINVEIPENKITVVIGSNGIGKTTLLRTIMGLSKFQKGTVDTDGCEMFYLPQKIKYPNGITLFEYIESSFYKDNWKWFLTEEDKQKITDIIETLGLSDKSEVNIECLSSGELQKANIALGLVSDAKVFLLDEPTSNMDLINQVKTLDMLKTLTERNITSVIVMHDINLASVYGDYFIGITKNRKIYSAEKDSFFTEEHLKEIFGIDFKVINNNEYINIQIVGN